MDREYEERICIEYTVLAKVTNKVLKYECEYIGLEQISMIGEKAVRLRSQYQDGYVFIKMS